MENYEGVTDCKHAIGVLRFQEIMIKNRDEEIKNLKNLLELTTSYRKSCGKIESIAL